MNLIHWIKTYIDLQCLNLKKAKKQEKIVKNLKEVEGDWPLPVFESTPY